MPSIRLHTDIPGPAAGRSSPAAPQRCPTDWAKRPTSSSTAPPGRWSTTSTAIRSSISSAASVHSPWGIARRPSWTRCTTRQKLVHMCSLVGTYESYVRLCELLNEITPGAFAKKTLLANSGAEAVENAVKAAHALRGVLA